MLEAMKAHGPSSHLGPDLNNLPSTRTICNISRNANESSPRPLYLYTYFHTAQSGHFAQECLGLGFRADIYSDHLSTIVIVHRFRHNLTIPCE